MKLAYHNLYQVAHIISVTDNELAFFSPSYQLLKPVPASVIHFVSKGLLSPNRNGADTGVEEGFTLRLDV